MTNAQDIIVAYLAAFNRGDWAGMLALLTDDVVHEINQGGVLYRQGIAPGQGIPL